MEGDLGKSLCFFHLTSPWLLREETPEKYKIGLLKIQRGSMPERKILLEKITFFIPVFLFWMTSLVISFIHESWGLVSLWSNLLAPLNNFARIWEIICHYNSFYSTMTHLLHNDSSEYSIRIFWILWLYFGCVKLHNDSSCSTLTHSAPQWLIGIFF